MQTDYLKRHVARVRDIELLTNFNFFSDISVVSSTHLRTYLPVSIWLSNSTIIKRKEGEWINQPCPSSDSCQSEYKPLVLISLDGFRADYIQYNVTPAIERLGDCGVKAPYMTSVYPTLTFPNHYSIVTGLYPESHGIVDNTMYDFEIKTKFSLSSVNAQDSRWWKGEPIWLTAKRQGKKSASYFWVGSDVKIQGEYPNVYRNYSRSSSYYDRIETVVRWLKQLESTRPDIVTLYFNEPDHEGHISGPGSEAVKEALRKVDNIIRMFMDELYQSDLYNCVNIMVLADHGMTPKSCDKVNDLSTVFTSDELNEFYVYQSGFGRIATSYKYKNSRSFTEVQNPFPLDELLSRIRCHLNLTVFTRSEVPKRFHYAHNDRIDTLILDNPDEWTISRKFDAQYCKGATHGYDNALRSMRALFVAHGPDFKVGYTTEPFGNIELYNIMCDLIGITPVPNNGTSGSLNEMLSNPKTLTVTPAKSVYIETQPVYNIYNNSCTICNITDASKITGIEESLSRSWNDKDDLINKHVPFGKPRLVEEDMNTVVIYQHSHVTAYNTDTQSPRWISATLKQSQSLSVNISLNECIYSDLVVSTNISLNSCPVKNQSTLLDLIKTEEDYFVLRIDTLPLLDGFRTGIWNKLQVMILEWLELYGTLNIISGPIYDYDFDGHGDSYLYLQNSSLFVDEVPVPTHVFLIITRCNTSQSTLSMCDRLHTISYIIPHTSRYDMNCQNVRSYLLDNEARVRDVELLTSLLFYPQLPMIDGFKLRMYLPHGFWN